MNLCVCLDFFRRARRGPSGDVAIRSSSSPNHTTPIPSATHTMAKKTSPTNSTKGRIGVSHASIFDGLKIEGEDDSSSEEEVEVVKKDVKKKAKNGAQVLQDEVVEPAKSVVETVTEKVEEVVK